MEYMDFVRNKSVHSISEGIECSRDSLSEHLFEYQKDIAQLALRRGRFLIGADVGMGKTLMQLEWARQLGVRTLILAPLAVAKQTVNEGVKFGYNVEYIRSDEGINRDCNIYITNYEMAKSFTASKFDAVVLDESSILKNLTGKTRTLLIEKFRETPYRLCCSATPAPNDIQELGNHAEFLGVMGTMQMRSVYFTHDSNAMSGSQSNNFRLKRHAVDAFYRWLASWSVAIRKPSDLGYSDVDYILPTVNMVEIATDDIYTPDGMLPGFAPQTVSAVEAKRLRKTSISSRIDAISDMINSSDEQWIIWTDLNDEAIQAASKFTDSINIHGSMKLADKIDGIMSFVNQDIKVLVTKPKIAGLGMNLQQCHNMVFLGIDYSWEKFYQSLGRINRFGQQFDTINVYIVIAEQSRHVWNIVQHKGKENRKMQEQLITAMKQYTEDEMRDNVSDWKLQTDTETRDKWTMMLGDSALRMKEMDDESIDFSIYSPPFLDMYIYNNSNHDLSNSKNTDDFFEHYDYLIKENLRVTKPGRLCAVHVMDTKLMKYKDGVRGVYDFSGRIIQAYVEAGWIFRARITIDKNPQAEAIRNHDTDLQFVTLTRDSANNAPVAPDYILLFKKRGDNAVPIKPLEHGVNRNDWITWAHAIWYDINQTDVLNVKIARENDDEKHMCPLQLPLINRAVRMWSNPGEVVFSMFGGIGSEGYEALRLGRKFHGIELKPAYYKVACRNLELAEDMTTDTLFDWAKKQATS